MFSWFGRNKNKVQVVKIGDVFFVKKDDNYLSTKDGSIEIDWWSRGYIKYATAFATAEEAEERWLLLSKEEVVKEFR